MTAAPADPAARHHSPWSRRDKAWRVLWSWTQGTLFRHSPRNAYRWRAMLLRTFGANLDGDVRIRPTVSIEVPWNLKVGRNTAIGDHAILYCLGPVTIGRFCTVSQYAHLCAGTHATNDRAMTLVRSPITLGDDVWVAADAFVGPGVTIGDRTILGARSGAFSDLPPDVIAVGSPARPVKPRTLPPA